MNKNALAAHIRERAQDLTQQEPRRENDLDNAELLNVLARVLEGKPIEKAFGAPGDWGYSTAIGKGIAQPNPA